MTKFWGKIPNFKENPQILGKNFKIWGKVSKFKEKNPKIWEFPPKIPPKFSQIHPGPPNLRKNPKI